MRYRALLGTELPSGTKTSATYALVEKTFRYGGLFELTIDSVGSCLFTVFEPIEFRQANGSKTIS
jgi:hypothetical protein